jgi:hypothetical protein
MPPVLCAEDAGIATDATDLVVSTSSADTLATGLFAASLRFSKAARYCSVAAFWNSRRL